MAPEKCDRCGRRAVIELGYGPHRLCENHFLHFFEKRVRRTVRTNRLICAGEKIVVGVSGGKDSLTTLYLLNKIFRRTNEIHALMIDEGIKGYRDKAIAIAKKNCAEWKVPFTVTSFKKNFGTTMVDVMRKTGAKKVIGSTCSFCGVMRRNLLNKFALELKADKLATGHNLDDEVQSILMNVFDADLQRFMRLGPRSGVIESEEFVPRIKPLYETPENEIIQFACMQGIRFYEAQCCPFKWQAKRNDFRFMLNEFEMKYPGTKYSILNFFRQAKPKLIAAEKENLKKSKIGKCAKCGSPTSGKECMVCRKLDLLETAFLWKRKPGKRNS